MSHPPRFSLWGKRASSLDAVVLPWYSINTPITAPFWLWGNYIDCWWEWRSESNPRDVPLAELLYNFTRHKERQSSRYQPDKLFHLIRLVIMKIVFFSKSYRCLYKWTSIEKQIILINMFLILKSINSDSKEMAWHGKSFCVVRHRWRQL